MDIKTENVLLTQDDSGEDNYKAVLTDFGQSIFMTEGDTSYQRPNKGTPAFMVTPGL